MIALKITLDVQMGFQCWSARLIVI